jgi:hypothetical protein
MRAKRYALQFPVYYREPESTIWFEGRTENISQSGLLFRGACPLQLQTMIELRMELIVAVEGEAPAEVLCKGAIVRLEQSRVLEVPTALAIAIKDYRLVRRRRSGEDPATPGTK